jgi:hypothetical protein
MVRAKSCKLPKQIPQPHKRHSTLDQQIMSLLSFLFKSVRQSLRILFQLRRDLCRTGSVPPAFAREASTLKHPGKETVLTYVEHAPVKKLIKETYLYKGP